MSAADTKGFIAAVDRHAAAFGLPTYSDLVRTLHDDRQRAATIYGALAATTEHAAAAEVCLMFEGEDVVAEARQYAARGRATGNAALAAISARTDLADHPDVAVLEAHRARRGIVGRRL